MACVPLVAAIEGVWILRKKLVREFHHLFVRRLGSVRVSPEDCQTEIGKLDLRLLIVGSRSTARERQGISLPRVHG